MSTLATQALPVLALFSPAFNPPTFQRVQLLAVAAILTTGRRTVSNLLRTLGHLAPGAHSSYHRVLSQAHWSGLRLAAALTRFLLLRFWPAGTVTLVGDDTVTEHPGRKVYGKASPRRRAFQPLLYGLGAGGTGRPGYPGPLPSPNDPGRCPCWWPCIAARGQRRARAAPQDPGQVMQVLLRLLRLVPRPLLPVRRRRWLWQPRDGHLRPADAGPTAPWSASCIPTPTCSTHLRQ